jgi:coenzyme F420-reducing hydrogenase gamma subunit
MGKKLRIGWFSFSCCEDSTIVFTELLNDYYKVWKEKVEFVSAVVLMKKSEIKNLDVAFVEGAITSDIQEKKLLEIRRESKKLVAIGSCACTGMPSSQRNDFDEARKAEIEAVLDQFHYADRVKKVSEIVKVDTQVPGCPMVEELFLRVMNMYLKEFGIVE